MKKYVKIIHVDIGKKYRRMKTREDKQKQNRKKAFLNPDTGMITLNITGLSTWINRY